MKYIIYDCETKRPVLGKDEKPLPGILYADGWQDYRGMGISLIAVYDSSGDDYLVFMEDNIHEFITLIASVDLLVSFNGWAFDDPLLLTHGIQIPWLKTYDILQEMYRADGLDPQFKEETHGGYSLEAACLANFRAGKSGSGALAPVLYQRQQFGKLITYGLRDVKLTRKLFSLIIEGIPLQHPKHPGKMFKLRNPMKGPHGK